MSTGYLDSFTGAIPVVAEHQPEERPLLSEPIPKKPRRNRASAKGAGRKFNRLVADWLALRLNDDRIDKMPLYGAKDRGDIAGVRLLRGGKVAVEVKDHGGAFKVTPWLDEAEAERGNYDADIGVVIAKRRGVSDPAQQVVFMTAETFAVLLEAGITDSPNPKGTK